ncbi:MAG: CoA ester lyase [Bradyrhizobiaceae bacterium]|nr:CoA ester lyase [Bradyrhizobiaceae bacterium]
MRSLLFVPANSERFLDKALSLHPSAFVLDLEDSVPEAEKANARALLERWAQRFGGKRVWVRINALSSAEFRPDVAAALRIGAEGIVVPKIDVPKDAAELDRALADEERNQGAAAGALRVIPLIESAAAVWHAYEIATSSPRMETLCFGGARDGDLMADLGCDWSRDGAAMLHARQHTLLAARAARCRYPLDGVFADVRDRDGFERDTRLSRSLGYRGRTVVHPSQIELADSIYRPTQDEIERSRRVVEAFAAAEAEGRATTVVDNRLVDIAMAAAARRLLEEAES